MPVSDKLLTLCAGAQQRIRAIPRSRLISTSGLLLALCAFGAAGVVPMAPDPSDLPVTAIAQNLALPEIAEQITRLTTQSEALYVNEEMVRRGDTLANVLQRLGVQDQEAVAFISSDTTAKGVLQLKAGKRIQARTTADGRLQWLNATVSEGSGELDKTLQIERVGDTFKAAKSELAVERQVEMRTGEIQSSLFAATDAARLPDSVASQIVDMFSTDIDFRSELRRGDRFNVVYETFWQGGEYLYSGRILAAEFRNGNNVYQNLWFEEPGSKQGGSYYDFNGSSLKKAFLKSPLEFTRISSGFSMRKHPVSGAWRQHKGVDFAAPTGTPIRAAGEGKVEFIGAQNGYGNIVIIKHWSSYTTAYAHMSRFGNGLRKGDKVNQGDIIGYVGSTGWATGPHLHYEFRVNNVAHDPMSIDIPNVQPLNKLAMKQFKEVAGEMSHRFALLTPPADDIKLAAK